MAPTTTTTHAHSSCRPGHCQCSGYEESSDSRSQNGGTMFGSGVVYQYHLPQNESEASEHDRISCKENGDAQETESLCFTSQQRNIDGLRGGIRKYYKSHNSLIDAYNDMREMSTDASTDEDGDEQTNKIVSFWSKVTFAVNFVLLLAKIAAAVISGSLVVISSMLDSAMDLVSGALMWWSNKAIEKTNFYFYPRGRRKLEPVAIVVLAVIMSFVSVQVIQESIQKIVIYATHMYDNELAAVNNWLSVARETQTNGSTSIDDQIDDQCWTSNDVNLSTTIDLVSELEATLVTCASQHGAPVFELPTILICVITIVVKLILLLICRRIQNHSVQALAKDHFNDVISNTGAVACGIIGYHLWKYADPIGAIVISVSIIINWSITAHSQIRMLTGYTAKPQFLKKVTWIALRHDERIRFIDRVIAFHCGSRFLVEVHIVLPAEMSMKESHDLSEQLQKKIERLSEVERAFVHTDYESEWYPTSGSDGPPDDRRSTHGNHGNESEDVSLETTVNGTCVIQLKQNGSAHD